MNKSLTILLFLCICGGIFPFECKANEKENSGFPTVISPDVPSHITFCGKRINLERADMYERFDRELTSIIYSHGSTMLMLKRANKYFPVIAPIIKAKGLPDDFIYLACAESTLNPRAYSPAKAAGLWQFIPATARQYGLEVNDEVDERYHIEKSTAAACDFFLKAYEKYNDWPTVMASYNAGMNRISTELEKQLSDSSFDLLLNDETSRYVFRIMAIKTILENPSKFGYKLKPEQFYRPVECTKERISTPIDNLATWAQAHGISYAQLKDENPWLRARTLTNKTSKTYTIKIPNTKRPLRSNQSHALHNSNWAN